MAKWHAHGAVFVENGKRRKGVVYLSDTAPKGRTASKARSAAKPRKRLFRRKKKR